MDCLQLAAIFCCVAIGNGSAVTCTARPSGALIRKTADIYSADDVNLLINGSQYLSHALVNLSAFVTVLLYEVHAMCELGGPGPRAISGGVLTDIAISLPM